MDFNVFLEKLDKNSFKSLFEGTEAKTGWNDIDEEYKEAMIAAGVSPNVSWAYQPANRNLVVVENDSSGNSWSVFTFNKVVGESKVTRGSRLYEEDDDTDRYSMAGGGKIRRGSKAGSTTGSAGSSRTAKLVADPVVENTDFKECLLECVEIVKSDLYKE